MKRITIAFLGVAHDHAHFWARAFRACGDVDLVGVWDADATLAADFAAAHGLAAADDRDALIAATGAVAITSATVDHGTLVAAAAAAGCAILCEKPLATDLAAAERIRDVVVGAGVPFLQSFPKRFDPVNAAMKAWLDEGAVGRPVLCRIRHGHGHGPAAAFQRGWFADPARSGGGTLLDEGVHAADLMRVLFGEPAEVSASIASTLGLPVEDTAAATFRYGGGLLAEVTTSWCFGAADASVEIFGTEGAIVLSGVDLASRGARRSGHLRLLRRTADGIEETASTVVPHFETGAFHDHVAWAFVAALRTGGPMPVTVHDGVRAAALIDAAYRSARFGRVERVAQPRSHTPPAGGPLTRR